MQSKRFLTALTVLTLAGAPALAQTDHSMHGQPAGTRADPGNHGPGQPLSSAPAQPPSGSSNISNAAHPRPFGFAA